MITVIKTKPNHPVRSRKKGQGGTHQNADGDCVPFGNLFSPFLCFPFLKNVPVVHSKCQKLVKETKRTKLKK